MLKRCYAGIFLALLIGLFPRLSHTADLLGTGPQGQSERELYSLVRDAGGFLWLGSGNGLYRYDGRRYLRFGGPSSALPLSQQNAGNLLLDRQQRLWVGTWGGGLNRVDVDTFAVRSYPVDADGQGGPSGSKVQTLFEQRNGTLWFGTSENGLSRYLPQTDRFAFVPESTGLRIWGVCEDPQQQLWAATDGGLARYAPESRKWQYWPAEVGNVAGFDHRQLRAIHCDAKGGIWLATRAGFGAFDPSSERYTVIPSELTAGVVINRLAAVAGSAEHLWLLTSAGLLRFNLALRAFEAISGESGFRLLPAHDLRDLLSADAQHIWLATRYAGLQMLRLDQRERRSHNDALAQAAERAQPPQVSALLVDGANVLIGSDAGLFALDRDTDRISRKADEERWRRPVRTLRRGPEGALWLLNDLGLFYQPRPDAAWREHTAPLLKAGISPLNINDLLPMAGGEVYLTTGYKPLLRLQPLTGELTLLSDPALDAELVKAQLNLMALDATQRLWISSFGGELFAFEPSTSTWTRFGVGASVSPSKIEQVITAADGRHWLATQLGLLRFDPVLASFDEVRLISGAATPIAFSALDASGKLWLNIPQGVLALDPASGNQSLFAIPERAASKFAGGALAIDEAGRVYTGGRDGLYSFAPRKLAQQAPPRVHLVGASVDNQAQPQPLRAELTVPARSRLLDLELATPAVLPEEAVLLRYRIGGLSDAWQAVPATERLQLGGLPPGRYQVEVAAARNPQRWGEPTALQVRVSPPWYRNPWWISLLLALLVSSAAAIHSARVRALQAQQRKLESIVEERTHALAVQQQQLLQADKMASLGMLTAGVAHEINNPVAFAHAASQNLEVGLREFAHFLHELAGDDAGYEVLYAIDERIARLQTQLSISLDGTQRIQGIVRDLRIFSRLDESNRKLANLEDGLRATLRLVETHYQKTVTIDTAYCGDATILCWPAQLNQVFMNLIVNACQALESQAERSGLGTLTIATQRVAGNLVITFTDNGPGMNAQVLERIFEPMYTTKASEQGMGMGLAISRDIVRKHGGEIMVWSELGQGARFSVELPVE